MSKNKHMNGPFGDKRGLAVDVRHGNIDGAIKLLNSKVKNEGLLREIRAREFYEKPSVVRRRKHAAAVSRARKTDTRRD